jgi:hypothetical protein
MNRRTRTAAAVVTAALLGAYATWRIPQDTHAPTAPPAATSEAAHKRAARITRMMLEDPALDRDEAGKLADRSDRMEARLAADGEPDVRRMLRDTHVSEQDARAYLDEHRALFGGRSFEASRLSIDRLLAIERVSSELDVE